VADTVAVLSGGLDSATLLYHLRAEGQTLRTLSFDYGQRHARRELACAARLAAGLGSEWRCIDLTSLAALFGRNALTDDTLAIPSGAYAPDTISQTLVPNRNMVLLSVAISWAIATGSRAVAFGAHAGDSASYPDCRPAFADAMDAAARICHDPPVRVLAPFAAWSKAQIVRRGAELAVPFAETWSCYRGGAVHCGECGTCLDRKGAFRGADVPDPTEYAG